MESNGLALLLLPPPPSTLSFINTKAAYGPAVDGCLKQIHRSKSLRLDVAITVPSSWLRDHDVPRRVLFEGAQKALAQTYSLICETAAHQQIELDCLGGVDARAFFLLPSREPTSEPRNPAANENRFIGPFVNLATLIGSRRSYGTVFGVESEEGEKLLRSFLLLSESKYLHVPTCQTVPGGLSITDPSNAAVNAPTPNKSHTSIAVGGTFDHLHIGHKLLLTATALLAEPKGSRWNLSQAMFLTIGISGDDLLTKKRFAEELENWDTRQQKVADFLESVIVFSTTRDLSRKAERISKPGPNGEYMRVTYDSNLIIHYVRISDPYGPTITDESISALIVSQETRTGGEAVNEKRQENGWPPLEILEIEVLDGNPGHNEEDASNPGLTSFESKISSTDIRRRIHEKRKAEG